MSSSTRYSPKLHHLISILVSLGGGCIDDGTGDDDGRDDAFAAPDGKGDANGISENSPEARGVLRVANESSRSSLRNDVGLGGSAASNIFVHRIGADETPGTTDDDRFETLAELDAVPWVGPISFDKMLAYATSRGWVVPATDGSTVLPGPACEGQFTELGRLNLMETKPIGRPPLFMSGLGLSSNARKLGPYTSTFWERKCDSQTGCTSWIAPPDTWAVPRPMQDYVSNVMAFRSGTAYLWSGGTALYLGVFTEAIEGGGPVGCAGWVQGSGELVRSGNDARATLAVAETDNCAGGIDPFWTYEGRDLHDPTGIVTDHCMKLTMSRKTYQVEVEPGRFVWREYLVSYDATF